jgi:hypothetical protein
MPYYYKRRRRRRNNRRGIHFYIVATLMCIPVAYVVSFGVEQLPTMVKEGFENVLAQVVDKAIGDNLEAAGVARFRDEIYDGDRIDTADLSGSRRASRGGIDPERIERLKKAYREGRIRGD